MQKSDGLIDGTS